MKELDEVIVRVGHIAALLEWDQETYLPPAAVEERSNQAALLVGLQHDKIIDSEWEHLFSNLDYNGESASSGFSLTDNAFVRECHKRWVRQTRIPARLVEALAKETSLSQASWAAARKADDFSAFSPHLKTVLSIKREMAAAIAPDKDAYDVLLDEYEPGFSGEMIAGLFDKLEAGLLTVFDKIRGCREPESGFLNESYSIDQQDLFGKRIQEFMGYDFTRGRLDLSAHPFTTTLGPSDVRVTTRYHANQVISGLFSNIHEAGHGLYEQGFGRELQLGLLADAASLGIHESQSRFWENVVGRSRAFWAYWYGDFRSIFPRNLSAVDLESFYKALNRVEPSLIRVEADEVSYSFHIIARFRLERALVRGELEVSDLPEAWNESYRDLLGLSVPDNASGCLQDVHWSLGLFGYFPTYVLGNLYAAQFTTALEASIGPLGRYLEQGHSAEILGWLRENIHVHGRIYPPEELCRRVSGKAVDSEDFLKYLESKYSDVYGFTLS